MLPFSVIFGLSALAIAVLFVVVLAVTQRGNHVDWKAEAQDMTGKTVLITGGESGMGFEVVQALVGLGANVIMATYLTAKANEAKERIVSSYPTPPGAVNTVRERIRVKYVDLSVLDSVRSLADDILKNERRLDVLINNAGAVFFTKQLTRDGLERTMSVNYFGHFLLTILLLPLMKRSEAARVVNVSSCVYNWLSMDISNLNCQRYFLGSWQTYSRSKLAIIYFTCRLSEQLQRQGSKITVNALHPGLVATSIFDSAPFGLRPIFKSVAAVAFRNAAHGAESTIYLATSASRNVAESTGKYFVDGRQQRLSKVAKDEAVSRKLWEVSERLVGLKNLETSQ